MSLQEKFLETVEKNFNKAIRNQENHYPEGGVNWNFVDADTYMDTAQALKQPFSSEVFYDIFEKLAESYEQRVNMVRANA